MSTMTQPPTPTLALIAALDKNRVIGVNGRIPWRLPDDLKWFREMTLGKPVLMGRKTYESIPAQFRPLPGRRNIVITRQPDYSAPGTAVVHTLAQALTAAAPAPEIIVAGGGELYAALLPQATRLYLTLVAGEFAGDAFFPPYQPHLWRERWRQEHAADERHPYSFTWLILERETTTHW